jgi:hypothetical protein
MQQPQFAKQCAKGLLDTRLMLTTVQVNDGIEDTSWAKNVTTRIKQKNAQELVEY